MRSYYTQLWKVIFIISYLCGFGEGGGYSQFARCKSQNQGIHSYGKKFVSYISLKLDTAPKTRVTLLKYINK